MSVSVELESEHVRSDFRALCRVCLKYRGVLNIFHWGSTLHKLTACAPIQITKDDGLPDTLCMTCAFNLDQAYCFRLQCEESDRRLESLRLRGDTKHSSLQSGDTKLDLNLDSSEAGQFEQLLIKKEESDADYDQQQTHSAVDSECAMRECELVQNVECHLKVELSEATNDAPGSDDPHWDDDVGGEPPSIRAPRAPPVEHACPYCPHRTSERREMREHILDHKNDTYECEVCGKTVRGAKRIRIHKNTHINTERTCEICGLVLHKYKLKSHIADKHNPKAKECPICNKVLSCRSSLTNHLQRHVDMELECDMCGKKYRNKISMRMHIKTHSTKKLFPCSMCDKRFSSDKYRTAHERMHTDAPCAFECVLCSRTFVTLKHHQTHVKNRHPEVASA